jgi:hypothetical protein
MRRKPIVVAVVLSAFLFRLAWADAEPTPVEIGIKKEGSFD